jgi:hypothetical protein
MSVQAQTSLLAHLTGKPGEADAQPRRVHPHAPQAPPMTMDYTVGCDAEGRLTAVRARIVGDSGAYASVGAKVLERAAGHSCGPTRCPTWTSSPWRPTPTTRPAARCAALASTRCTSRWKPAWTCWPRRPVWTAGPSAGATPGSRRCLRHRAGAGKVGGHPQDAAGHQAALRRGHAVRPRGGHCLRREEQRHRQRRGRIRQGAPGGAARRPGDAVQRLHRDGPGPDDGAGAVCGGGDRPAGIHLRAQGRHQL